jgi:hypothetical protein
MHRRRKLRQQQLPSTLIDSEKGSADSPPGTGTNKDSMHELKPTKRCVRLLFAVRCLTVELFGSSVHAHLILVTVKVCLLPAVG